MTSKVCETTSPRQYAMLTSTAIIRRKRRHLLSLTPKTLKPIPVKYSTPAPAKTPARHIAEKFPDLPHMNVPSKRLITPSLKALEIEGGFFTRYSL